MISGEEDLASGPGTSLVHARDFVYLSFIKVKEERNVGLKLNIQKSKIMASRSITSWQIDGETVETMRDYFEGLQNQCRW